MQSVGMRSIQFEKAPYIIASSAVGGEKEGEGPLSSYYDRIEKDPYFGQKTWEEGESALLSEAIETVLKKAGKTAQDIKYLFAGDLLGQSMATSFGVKKFEIPWFGLFGACSTMGESIQLGAMAVAAGYADAVIAATSSHFASAEKTFRFPLAYGSQKPFSAGWTTTGAGAVILGTERSFARVTGVTTGKIVDYGLKDSQNMGACMAPAAVDTIITHLTEFGRDVSYYDKIITGDLGVTGSDILIDLCHHRGYDLSKNHMDCGKEIYDGEAQDTHNGGSGCGCAASVLGGYILTQIKHKKWKKILFVPTGALMSTVSFNEGLSVPGIAHGVVIEAC